MRQVKGRQHLISTWSSMCACCASPAQESGVAASSLLGLHAYSSTASTSDADLHKASPAKQQHRDAGVMYQSEASTSNLSSSTSVGWMAGPQASRQAKRVDEEWHAVTDQATGAVHYRSVLTGATTTPGTPKPDTWIEVVDKQTGLLYYWCKRTGETTGLGEPKPGPYGRRAHHTQDALLDEDAVAQGSKAERRSRAEAASNSSNPPGMLSALITNPVVIGVVGLSACAIGYELFTRSGSGQ